jgi:hypothetical protein
MFLALDFEWWEKAEDVILEVGWSLWDSLTQQHRTRHWVVKEHLNKVRLQYIFVWLLPSTLLAGVVDACAACNKVLHQSRALQCCSSRGTGSSRSTSARCDPLQVLFV